MRPRQELVEEDVLGFLRARTTATVREIASALGLKHPGRRALGGLLARLKYRRLVEEVRSGKYRLAGAESQAESNDKSGVDTTGSDISGRPPKPAVRDPHLLVGRLVAHRDGYGFVVPESPRKDLEGDLFIPPDQLGDAMHGDQVIARIERRDTRRNQGPGVPARAEGRIVRVLGRAHPTVVGVFHYAGRSNFVVPYESRLHHEIVIPSGQELTPELVARHKLEGLGSRSSREVHLPEVDGAVVNVEITRFPRSGVAAAGRVIEILGRPGDFGVDVEILIRKHHLPYRFPEEVLEQVHQVTRPIGYADLEGRRDFRLLPIVTIDGETARDFDDAVYVERRPDGWHLQVHIADVAHYVDRGSPLDREARLRGTSVYFPDRAVPMLPEELSNGICSLNPHVDRLVMSVVMQFDETGKRRGAEFMPGVIRSAERMTYTNVNKVLDGDGEALARYAS